MSTDRVFKKLPGYSLTRVGNTDFTPHDRSIRENDYKQDVLI